MPRPRSPNRDKALQLWLDSGQKRQLKDIAAELQVSEEQIRKWKNQDKWDKVTLPNAKGNVTNHKGAPAGNQNAVGHGAPKQNKNAEKYGFFSKYLPEETGNTGYRVYCRTDGNTQRKPGKRGRRIQGNAGRVLYRVQNTGAPGDAGLAAGKNNVPQGYWEAIWKDTESQEAG